MLLDGHELDNIVAGLLDAIQIIIGKLTILGNAPFILSHTDVGLVDAIRLGWNRHGLLVSPLELLGRIPEDVVEKIR